jgi:hypothetical protein
MGQAMAIVVARGLHGGAPTKLEIEEADKYIPQNGDPKETLHAQGGRHAQDLGGPARGTEVHHGGVGEPEGSQPARHGGHRRWRRPEDEGRSGEGGRWHVRVREKASGKVKSLPADQAQSVLADPRFEQAP